MPLSFAVQIPPPLAQYSPVYLSLTPDGHYGDKARWQQRQDSEGSQHREQNICLVQSPSGGQTICCDWFCFPSILRGAGAPVWEELLEETVRAWGFLYLHTLRNFKNCLHFRCQSFLWSRILSHFKVRDTVNLAVVAYHVASLVTSLVTARSPPTAIARSTVLQHPVTAFRDVACTRADAYRISRFVSTCSAEKIVLFGGAPYEVQFEENILWSTAYLTVAVSKMLYFNTLFTYLQTLKMFREIQLSSERQREGQCLLQNASEILSAVITYKPLGNRASSRNS